MFSRAPGSAAAARPHSGPPQVAAVVVAAVAAAEAEAGPESRLPSLRSSKLKRVPMHRRRQVSASSQFNMKPNPNPAVKHGTDSVCAY